MSRYENYDSNVANRRGEIYFNDYDTQNHLSPEAKGILKEFDDANEKQRSGSGEKALAELAIMEAAARGDWDQSRIDAAREALNKTYEDAK